MSLKRGVLRIACLYLPNGNPPDTDKYPYKLKWMKRLAEYSSERLKTEEPFILAGDFNVIPAPEDVHNPAAWAGDALFLPQTRESFRALTGTRPHRRAARGHRRAEALHLLGLSGRRLAEEQRHPHRPPAAVAAGLRPPGGGRHRQACARLGKALRPRAGLGRSGPRDARLDANKKGADAAPGSSKSAADQSRRPCTQRSSIRPAMARSSSFARFSALV